MPCVVHGDADEKWSLEDAEVGVLPTGWIAGATDSKQGTAPRWNVVEVDGHKVLAQRDAFLVIVGHFGKVA